MSAATRLLPGSMTRPLAMIDAAFGLLDRIPHALIAVVARIGLAEVFWSSAQAHLANWQTTLYLFENNYHVPLLPPDISAYVAVAVEIATPPLLILGLATRFASLVLFGMTMVIEIFVYPQAWPTHIQWVVMQLVLIAGGPGLLSVDALIRRMLPRAG